MMKSILLFSYLFAINNRIEMTSYDKTKVLRVNLVNGMVSKIKFPCEIKEVFTAKTNSFHIEISESFSSELNVSFLDPNAKALNVIVKCSKTREFVLDFVPNRSTHQDLVVIEGSFGFLTKNSNESPNMKLIDSSDNKRTFIKILEESSK